MGTMWRPTVRCDSIYKDYVETLSKETSLDKNQIMRLMMFTAAHSEQFQSIIAGYKKSDVTPLPSPNWQPWEDGYWLNQTYKGEGGGGVSAEEQASPQMQKQESKQTHETSLGTKGMAEANQGREGAVHTIRIKNQGGIVLKL